MVVFAVDDVWIVRGPGGYREVLGDVMEADDVDVNVKTGKVLKVRRWGAIKSEAMFLKWVAGRVAEDTKDVVQQLGKEIINLDIEELF